MEKKGVAEAAITIHVEATEDAGIIPRINIPHLAQLLTVNPLKVRATPKPNSVISLDYIETE